MLRYKFDDVPRAEQQSQTAELFISFVVFEIRTFPYYPIYCIYSDTNEGIIYRAHPATPTLFRYYIP